MGGWKTWLGVAFVGVGAGLRQAGVNFEVPDLVTVANTVQAVGAALGLVGVAHKIEKNA